MNTFSFVDPNFQQGPKELNAYYLPYSAGVLVATALNSKKVNNLWNFKEFIWRREDIDNIINRFADCNLIAFSTYIWNKSYNYSLAKAIKNKYPEMIIIFGGPEMAITNPKLFSIHPYIDIVVKSEGEKVFTEILEKIEIKKESKDILINILEGLLLTKGLLINLNGEIRDTGDSERIENLDYIKSPYLTGVFDKLIKNYPEIEWHGTLETNRGCPYQCTFCDWGSLTYNKVKKFEINNVFLELDWMGEYCGYITITDANFGMFVERDNLIIDRLIEVQKKWGKLKNFSITWAKNQKNEVVQIVKKLVDKSPFYGAGLTVSVQSMDDNVLTLIKRKNLDQHKIDEIFSICSKENIPVYTELILGLPGDNVHTWKNSIWSIFKAGNHYGINILHAALLENAELNLLQRRLYKLESTVMYDYMGGNSSDTKIKEGMEIVVSTKDMPRTEMLEIMTWNSFIQAFHINGLSTYLARIAYEFGTDYSLFYENLYKYLIKDDWILSELAETKYYYKEWTNKGYISHPNLGKMQIYGWNLHNRLTYMIHHQKKLKYVFNLIEEYLRKNYNFIFMDELIEFQRASIIEYDDLKKLPIKLMQKYDFNGFLNYKSNIISPAEIIFDTTEDKNMSNQMFLENFWFARKRNFGRARVEVSKGNPPLLQGSHK